MKKVLFYSVLSLFVSQTYADENRPNIIIILADDMGYSDIGCMGGEIKTPNLDKLAENGMLFTHCYNASRSCPSRASLLTGLYQHKAGIGFMDSNLGIASYQGFLNDKCVTIAEVLKDANYRTIMVGKWHVGSERDVWPDKRGFERFYGIPKGGGIYFYPSKFIDRTIYKDGKKIIPDSSTFYTTDNFTTEAINYISEAHSDHTPFFLYLSYIAPHFPLQAWKEDICKYKGTYDKGYDIIRNARFKKQKYLGIVADHTDLPNMDCVNYQNIDGKQEARKMEVYAAQIDRMDSNIGRLVSYLKSIDQYDNTVIIFLSDNGGSSEEIDKDSSAEIGSVASFTSYGKAWANISNTPYRKYKQYEHEGGILTPLIFHWPNGVKVNGRIINDPIHIIDILPTCLDLLKIQYPLTYKSRVIHPVDGVSFKKKLYSESNEQRIMYWEHMGNKAIRCGDWKLVMTHGSNWELYNLRDDPTELEDISHLNVDIVIRLSMKWNNWARENNVKDWPVVK